MINALITLLIVAIFVGLIYWVVDAMGVPPPLNKFIKIAAIVIGAIAVVLVLANMAGWDTGFRGVR